MRTLAIGDIHGCLKAFDHILRMAKVKKTDTIITLGDYVDRGPDSKGVIDRLLWLQTQCSVIPLKGNHEVMMMEARGDSERHQEWLTHGGRQTLRSYAPGKDAPALQHVPEEHWQFIEQTLNCYETDHHIFVHAGVDPDTPLDEQPEYQLFWEFISPNTQPHFSGKTVICGHTSQKTGRPLHLGHTICLDTFAYGGGFLTCMDVKTSQVWQASESGMKREFVLFQQN